MQPAPNKPTGPVEIITILDRSGSMGSIRQATVDGFNLFLGQQKDQPQEARFTLVLFDDQYEVPIPSTGIQSVPLLTLKTFQPRGSTALYDAIGRTCNELQNRILQTPIGQRPKGVIIAILTDGEENSSRYFNQHQVADLIAKHRETDKWEFIFLAANQDAIASAGKINILADDAACFNATAQGTAEVFYSKSERVSEKRGRME
jgi:Mg-chelatase subunit ChlD